MKPVFAWEDLDNINEKVVWQSRLDGRYQIEVHRIDGETHRGIFMIWDKEQDFRQIYAEDVPLMYGAQFGPDVEDVQSWMDKGCVVVDNLNGNSPEA